MTTPTRRYVRVLLTALLSVCLVATATAQGKGQGRGKPPKGGTSTWQLDGVRTGVSPAGHPIVSVPPLPGTIYRLLLPMRANILSARGLSLTVQIATTGTPFFDWRTEPWNTCNAPPTARPYFERVDPGQGVTPEFRRWWSNPAAIELRNDGTAAGTFSLFVPFDPAVWSSVNGRFGTDSPEATAGFRDTLTNLGAIGFSFGGGCFFGHGIFLSGGTATLEIRQFAITY